MMGIIQTTFQVSVSGLRRAVVVLALLLVPGMATAAESAGEPQRYGWIEKVRIEPGSLELKAKLDTGARTSSLNALDAEVVEKDGRKWVRFGESGPDGERALLDRPVTRWVRIKRHGSESQQRPVVPVGVCLNGIYRVVEVSLTDRSEFNYQILLGRNFLAGVAFVDSSETFTSDPHCEIAADSPRLADSTD
jgi:hypothetical protein